MEPSGRFINRRQFVQRSALGLTALSAVGVLEACGGGSGAQSGAGGFADARPPAKPVGVFRRPYAGEPDTLDPAAALGGGLPLIAVFYEGLARYADDYSQLVPSLATSWRQSDDGREWEFVLRQGVTFHDGEPLDAAAVKATFDYFKAKRSFSASLLPEFDTVDASDPTRIRFVLRGPWGDFLRNQAWLKIMSPKLIKAGSRAIEAQPAGTGAYMLASRKPGRSFTMAANPDYWGAGPFFERIEMPLITDPAAQVNALLSRQVDQINSVSPASLPQLESNKAIELLESRGWRISYLHFTTTNPNVADKRIRQAVAYAIDRTSIVERLLRGRATVATSVMPQGTYGHVDADQQFTYDPDRARELLREAGSGPGHPIRMATLDVSSSARDVSQAIVGNLKDAGFDATLDVKDPAVVTKEWAKPRPKWDMYYDEHSWLNGGPLIFSIELIQQLSRFNPEAFKDLNAKQKATPDGPERLQALADMQNLVQDESPYIGLWVARPTDAERVEIQGYKAPPDAISYRYADTYRATA
jgi:peptide/nickel transport system substrate-binding protein